MAMQLRPRNVPDCHRPAIATDKKRKGATPPATGETMMKRLLLTTPALALLFACSGSSTTLQPGQWEMTSRMTEIEVPGVPEAVAAQMRAAMANQAQTQSRCITPAEAANPAAGMMNPTGSAEGCTFTNQTFAGGVINVAGSCPAPGGRGQVTTTLAGTYTATTMTTTIRAEVTSPPGGPPGMPQTVRMSGTMAARRTGDCATS
jgi:hypothetical protein